jgi:hypothetical protein
LKRLSDIEKEIRDCEITSLKLNWSNQKNIEIKFLKNKSEICLIIEGAQELDLFEDEFESYYISHVKCLIDDENLVWLSLDPYDERIDEIEERDNFKIQFKNYKIKITEK